MTQGDIIQQYIDEAQGNDVSSPPETCRNIGTQPEEHLKNGS